MLVLDRVVVMVMAIEYLHSVVGGDYWVVSVD